MDNQLNIEKIKNWEIDLDKIKNIEDVKNIFSLLNITLSLTDTQFNTLPENQRAYFKEHGNSENQGS